MADAERCSLCGDAGWVLDAKVDRDPTTLELLPCLFPDCRWSGRDVAVLCLGGQWDRPAPHPVSGAVMSLQRCDRMPDGRAAGR